MAIYFKLTKIEEEDEKTYERSKMLGSPVFPKGFVGKHKLNDALFICQLNLSEMSDPKLPTEGFLYIFLNIDTYPYKPKVFYTNEEVLEVFDTINEGFDDYGDPNGYLIEKVDEYDGFGFLTEFDPSLDLDSQIDTSEYACLLEIDSINLPVNTLTLGQPDGWYMFLIKEEDLKAKNFKNVKFITYGS